MKGLKEEVKLIFFSRGLCRETGNEEQRWGDVFQIRGRKCSCV
jgi:hypothetical protein